MRLTLLKMKKKISLRSEAGMTLIEVLIASTILFIAIGTVAGIHRVLNHYQRISYVDYVLLLNQSSLFDSVDYSLQQNELEGIYSIGKNNITWKATLNKKAPIINSWDPEVSVDGAFTHYGKISLYDVNYHLDSHPDIIFKVTKFVVEPSEKITGI